MAIAIPLGSSTTTLLVTKRLILASCSTLSSTPFGTVTKMATNHQGDAVGSSGSVVNPKLSLDKKYHGLEENVWLVIVSLFGTNASYKGGFVIIISGWNL